jgi:hypothetical protein
MFHSSNPSLFGRGDSVLSTIYALRASVAVLRRISLSLQDEMSPDYAAASGALSDLSSTLATYFDAEESGGYFAGNVDDCPEFQGRIHKLEETHEHLRDTIASALHMADRGERSEMPGLGRDIDCILEQLEQHERAENELMQDFFLSDGG